MQSVGMKPVVVHGSLLGRFAAGLQEGRLRVPVLARRLAAELVDRPVARCGDDPTGGTRGQSCRRPPLHGRRERVLDGLLGDVDIAEDAHQDGHGATVLLAENALDLRGCKRGHVW